MLIVEHVSVIVWFLCIVYSFYFFDESDEIKVVPTFYKEMKETSQTQS